MEPGGANTADPESSSQASDLGWAGEMGSGIDSVVFKKSECWRAGQISGLGQQPRSPPSCRAVCTLTSPGCNCAKASVELSLVLSENSKGSRVSLVAMAPAYSSAPSKSLTPHL